MTFGEKFRKLIASRGWSINQTLRKIGQYPKTADRWFKAEGQPSPNDLLNISNLFGCDVGWLIDDTLGWDDQPAYNSETLAYAQVIQVLQKIGAKEALARITSPRAIKIEDPDREYVPAPPAEAKKPRKAN